jgi:hypothetical protein
MTLKKGKATTAPSSLSNGYDKSMCSRMHLRDNFSHVINEIRPKGSAHPKANSGKSKGDNDTCMHLFVNSLEGKAVTDFFDLPPKILSTWEELIYWFKSTYGQSKIPTEKLWEYNNVTYKDGETIKSFNLHFTKLYNQIP